jgi:hypothetical protein
MKKANKSDRISIEFNREHLTVLVSALETYSRLQSGQVKMAIDEVYCDRNISYEEGQYIENTVRFIAFPKEPAREYDGHGGFYDQYNNQYDEIGSIVEESEEWKDKKNRPHLNHVNSSFGVGCKEMRTGTIAWEIKKAIQEYLHYERNDGYRDMGVDGDGVLNISGIPQAKILDPIILSSFKYWKPEKAFRIPQRYQEKVSTLMKNEEYSKVWQIVDKSFKNKPLPMGKLVKIEELSGTYYVVVEKPIKKEEYIAYTS